LFHSWKETSSLQIQSTGLYWRWRLNTVYQWYWVQIGTNVQTDERLLLLDYSWYSGLLFYFFQSRKRSSWASWSLPINWYRCSYYQRSRFVNLTMLNAMNYRLWFLLTKFFLEFLQKYHHKSIWSASNDRYYPIIYKLDDPYERLMLWALNDVLVCLVYICT